MLDRDTINGMRLDRRNNMSYLALSMKYGLPVSTIEYWVNDITPVKFTSSGTEESLSGRKPEGAFPLSRNEAVKLKKEVHFTANAAVHQSEEVAKVLEKVDGIYEYLKQLRVEPESSGSGGTSYVKKESLRFIPPPEPEPPMTFPQIMVEAYKMNWMMNQMMQANEEARRQARSRELDDFIDEMMAWKVLKRALRD